MADETGRGSKAHVALDLMLRIATAENKGKTDPAERSYWLKLYHECYKAAGGHTPS